jgi:hypothetical protein
MHGNKGKVKGKDGKGKSKGKDLKGKGKNQNLQGQWAPSPTTSWTSTSKSSGKGDQKSSVDKNKGQSKGKDATVCYNCGRPQRLLVSSTSWKSRSISNSAVERGL